MNTLGNFYNNELSNEKINTGLMMKKIVIVLGLLTKKTKVLKSGILSDSKNCLYLSDHFPVFTELIIVKD